MFIAFVLRKLGFLVSRKKNGPGPERDVPENPPEKLDRDLSANLKTLQALFGNSSDLKTHPFRFGPEKRLSGALVFLDGLTSSDTLTEGILRPVTNWAPEDAVPSGKALLDAVSACVLCAGEITRARTVQECAAQCLSGNTVLLLDGCAAALCVSAKGWEKRSITEPESETVVRGPREGFTENLRTNTSMIRRKIKSPRLRAESLTVGRKTRTQICLMYLDGVAAPETVEAVRYRIGHLEVDSILESGYIEEYIEDAPFSPFPTVGYTEKPDVAAGKLLEGRVAVVVDGTPFVLTAPMLFIESFQTAEDYYSRPLYASCIRLLRYIAYTLTLFAPALYIAFTAFHPEFIPTTLLFTIANAREGTPFPVFLEMAIMIFTFELLREAGIRLPRPVGQAISIVGALVMGDAAVSAGLVGAPVVITIAVTAVAGFLVPAQNESASLLRVVLMALSAFVGWYGIALGAMAILIHLGSLRSFGVPYFDGFAVSRDLQDSVVRMPLWSMLRRPKDLARGDTTRRGFFFLPPLRPFEPKEETDGEEEL